ncbi:hypothetical protein PtrSN002B_011018 [Pyrenophora tritici-repentis]|nr:hypothetical protein Alg215_08686 [Pyrenophora tritici-repentis]KAI0576542.1 hypothetical protein Alg130_08739 [Pyrenophora tritici-repentis]KAI0607106.1 hypothetical protein TUN205_08643 [Pyrenophora tritici-repentis]KAI0619067.1 hypothetical protein TUN199_08937 [Pyrenophora tritici-repentis]KAI1530164.1 hypothetical protein PtrSN002B_011018 [Pyrenophora tritici-repentis]
MSNAEKSTELALQVFFGIFGVIGTIATLAGLHRHDSLGCVLVRRMRGRQIIHEHGHDVEAFTSSLASLADVTDAPDDTVPCERKSTLPPTYEQSSDGSHSEAIFGSDLNASLFTSKATEY